MATPLRLRADRNDDGSVVLTAVGELDMSNVADFSEAIDAAVTAGTDGAPLHVDLSAVAYLDSGAINVLFDHVDGVDIVAHPDLMAVLKISGLSDVGSIRSAT